MSDLLEKQTRTAFEDELEFVTFYVGGMLMGIDIQQAQEINCNHEITQVPHSPECVRGVLNLRGEVVTVVDLRKILCLEEDGSENGSHNIIVQSGDERIGLVADKIAGVVYAKKNELEAPPANISGVEGRFFKGVFKLENELLVVLDCDEILAIETVLAE